MVTRRGRGLSSQDPVLQLQGGVNRASLGAIGRFNQESRSTGNVVMK